MSSIDEALALISRGADEILKVDDLRARLESGKPLRIKAGFDPNDILNPGTIFDRPDGQPSTDLEDHS